MKTILLLVLSLSATSSMAMVDLCKKGDLKDCDAYLKGKTGNPEEFASAYEDICVANKSFKCLKIVVRGDVQEEMKFQKEEHPKARMYNVKVDGEEKIFMLEKK